MIVTAVAVIVAAAVVASGCSDDNEKSNTNASTTVAAKPPASASGTITDYVEADATLSTLASIIAESKLAETLSSTGPYTLFAPTNTALDSFSPEQLEALRATTDALDLHVVEQRLPAADLIPLDGTNLETLGGPVPVTIDGRTLKIANAAVIRTDVFTSNGVIHVIDAVIAPAAP